jgi:hypothetical protein
VVGEQRRVLVLVNAIPLQPAREGGVQRRALGLQERVVGDVARERVLDYVLELARHRRPRAATHELALLQHAQVGHALDKLAHRPHPERPPDHGRGLERRLLRRR